MGARQFKKKKKETIDRTVMRSRDKTSQPAKPKEIAERIASRAPFDRNKSAKANQRAVEAADRLLKEMGDVLKHLEKKR